MRRVLISIVCYRAGDVMEDCLRSLQSEVEALHGSHVIVVDNESQDGSADAVRAAVEANGWDDWVTLLEAGQNGGYAAGNNLSLRYALEKGIDFDYMFYLNPDTQVRPGAIQALVELLERQPEVGIAGSRSEDVDATPQHCCFRFSNAINEFACQIRLGVLDRLLRRHICRVPISDEAHAIDWVSGAAMLVRRAVFEQIGLMDEEYFLYYEENDFIYRARQKGWICWHVPQSRVVHYVGHSSGVTRRDVKLDRKPYYWFDSRRRFFLKNRGKLYATIADAAALSGIALWNLRCFLSRRDNPNPPYLLRDTLRKSVFLTGFRSTPPRGESVELKASTRPVDAQR